MEGQAGSASVADRMTRLGAMITESSVLAYGRDELLRELAATV
jgi:hypothetical protein